MSLTNFQKLPHGLQVSMTVLVHHHPPLPAHQIRRDDALITQMGLQQFAPISHQW